MIKSFIKTSSFNQIFRLSSRNLSSSVKVVTGAFGFSKIGSGLNRSKLLPARGSFPKPDECGEDSFFISETIKRVGLGVADGVSSFGGIDTNSANFSRALMRHSAVLFGTNANFESAADALRIAFYRTIDEGLTKGKNNAGASTACVVSINKEWGKVDFGNLGDSGFMLLSENENGKYVIKQRSKSLQYSFNCPYQYTFYGDGRFYDESALIDCEKWIGVKPGDIILVMTDGVLDNIYDAELEEVVTETLKKSKDDAKGLAEEIAFKSYELSKDTKRLSPFGVEARKAENWEYDGGKPDDITVVAAIIQ